MVVDLHSSGRLRIDPPVLRFDGDRTETEESPTIGKSIPEDKVVYQRKARCWWSLAPTLEMLRRSAGSAVCMDRGSVGPPVVSNNTSASTRGVHKIAEMVVSSKI